ncbi:MAG: hypothetical protein ACOZNI_12660 [Myxococcota bacterium]
MRGARLAVVVAGLVAVALSASRPAQALPAYSRLYEGKYGYRPSCVVCHTAGGGSTVTDYGRDFLRAGANFGAYAKVEGADSDGDGARNLDEIQARSDAGDARSTPAKPGDWLADALKVPVPTDQLKKLFPDAEGFTALEGTLSAAQVATVEQRTGAKLDDEDRLPTFYFAVKGGKKVAVAQYVSARSPKGPISLAVAMDTGATVTGVRVLKNPGPKAIEAADFLAQFRGKRPGDGLVVGKDLQMAAGAEDASREVAVAVAKAIAIIQAVFGR